MLSNILIALGFLGTGILVGLGLAAYTAIKFGKNKSDEKKDETKKVVGKTVTLVYAD